MGSFKVAVIACEALTLGLCLIKMQNNIDKLLAGFFDHNMISSL